MRVKILIVFVAITLGIGVAISVLGITLLKDSKESSAQLQSAAERAVKLATLQWQADMLERQRWLDGLASAASVQRVFTLGTVQARASAATDEANRLLEQARRAEPSAEQATLLCFVDAAGVVLGRNGGESMRGVDVGGEHSDQWRQVTSGHSASAIWFSFERREQQFVSMVPIMTSSGEFGGAIAIGSPLSDEVLTRAAERSLGVPLLAFAVEGPAHELLAKSQAGNLQPLLSQVDSWLSAVDVRAGREVIGGRLDTGQGVATLRVASAPASIELVAVAGTSPSEVERLLIGVWGVIAVALVLVFFGSSFIARPYSRAVAELEEGLLQVINGDEAVRFESDHPELGGLAARINGLLEVEASSANKLAKDDASGFDVV
jgi:hypothetical protein